ncbi:hypothetical protein [Microbacterium maritypicum]|uniref:hypothetical protein n=1 Tax=Microbacterium maritypicum TaxID=33918 RepID=UPI001267A438|nr:hypothetical protein [Microbacterium liquefaciens]
MVLLRSSSNDNREATCLGIHVTDGLASWRVGLEEGLSIPAQRKAAQRKADQLNAVIARSSSSPASRARPPAARPCRRCWTTSPSIWSGTASSTKSILGLLTDIGDVYDKAEPAERRMLNRALFDRITIDDEDDATSNRTKPSPRSSPAIPSHITKEPCPAIRRGKVRTFSFTWT